MKLFLTVIIMEILAGAEVDLFVPSFPDLQNTFNLSPFMVEWLLGVNLIAYCITSLIVGNLGDRYGRKPIIIIGLFIFNLGSLLCIVANSYQLLLSRQVFAGCRYIIGSGACICSAGRYLFSATTTRNDGGIKRHYYSFYGFCTGRR